MIQFRQMLPKLVIGHFISVPHCVHHGDVAHGAGAYEPSSLVDAQHHRLAIDDEPLVPVLERGLDDLGIAVSLVVAAAGDQARSPSRSRRTRHPC